MRRGNGESGVRWHAIVMDFLNQIQIPSDACISCIFVVMCRRVSSTACMYLSSMHVRAAIPDHEEELHEVIVHRRRGRLHDEHVGATHILHDLDRALAIVEPCRASGVGSGPSKQATRTDGRTDERTNERTHERAI